MKRLMLIISALFHPLLMATYSCIILYFTIPVIFSPVPINAIPFFIIAIFLTTALIPALSVGLMRYSNHISHCDIPDRKERKIPFLVIAMFYGLSTYMLNERMSLNPVLLKLMVLVTSLIFLIYLINLVFKVSVHAAAMCGVAGFFSAFVQIHYTQYSALILALLFALSGLLIYSRLSLNRHTPKESWFGALLGFVYFYFGFFLIS